MRRNPNRMVLPLVVAFLLVGIAACETGNFQTSSSSTEVSVVNGSGTPLAPPLADDIGRAVQAIVALATGESPGAVADDFGVVHAGPVPVLHIDHKDLTELSAIVTDRRTQDGLETVSGILALRDDIGRRANAGFHMRLAKVEAGLAIDALHLAPMFAGAPRIEVFAVPSEALDALPAGAHRSYAALYRAIRARALPLSRQTGLEDIVFFVKDPLVPEGRLRVAEARSWSDEIETGYRHYDNAWTVGALRTSRLPDADPVRALTFLYKPGVERAETPVGRFAIGAGWGADVAARPALGDQS